MSVTNYLPICKYNYSKLKDVLYLVSAEHIKNVHIDNGEAYINGLLESPLKINGYNIQFNEESSLDERFKFQKTLTLSMHGYVNYKLFEGKYYAIIEDVEGILYMINVDFPSKVTHTFNLSTGSNQTDFTFSSLSNFPTLKLNADFEAVTPVCLGYKVYGIDKLQLIESDKARLDTVNKSVVTTEDFKTIEFLGNSCSFQEVYDGQKVTDTITFNIALDNYKPSFQYNLLEFLENRYSAIISTKGNDNKYYLGFNFGLQPSYTIQTSNKGESDIITITLTEQSQYGSTAAVDWDETQEIETRWRYVNKLGDIVCFECVGLGEAIYLVQQEVDYLGNPTGNYKVLQGYESQYPTLHIVGTFSQEELFNTNDCSDYVPCAFTTDIPLTIDFTSTTCHTYSLNTSCDWYISNLPSNITVQPMSGVANSTYNVSICNTSSATENPIENYFTINCCNNRRIVNCKVQRTSNCIRPQTQYITCLNQDVAFTFDGSCRIQITEIDPRLTYAISDNILTVRVPRNYDDSATTYSIVATNCDCSSSSTYAYISQDHPYYRWVEDRTDFMCVSGHSYTVMRKYSGATSGNITYYTSETRRGNLIQLDDPRCSSSIKRWGWDNETYDCVDGNLMQVLFEWISYDDGQTWQKTGQSSIGPMVESASSYCNSAVTYSWQLTSLYHCMSSNYKFFATYSNNDNNLVQCDASSALTASVTKPIELDYTTMEFAEIGECVTSIGNYAFEDCISLSSCTIPTTVTSIGEGAFSKCSSLTSINLPNNLGSIGEGAFSYCSGLTSIDIPSGVTSISGYAFYDCSGMTSAIIGSGVTSIGNSAFQYCSGLNSIVCYATNPPTLGSSVFGSTNSCPIYVPSGSVNAYKSAWSSYSSRIQAL